jgi:hypothetical protein
MLRRPSLVLLSVAALVIALSAWGVGLARQDQRARDRQSAIDTRREIEDLRGELDASGPRPGRGRRSMSTPSAPGWRP